MNRLAAALLLPCLLLSASMSSAATATNAAPAPSPAAQPTTVPSTITPSTAAPPVQPGNPAGTLSGVPTPADIEAAALRLAGVLGGVLRNCPAAYAAVGTPGKRCLGISGDVDAVRLQLSSALGGDLYGVWRSRDDQRTVFNWIKAPSGAVYLRVAADPANPARSLVYLDAPTVQASELNTPGKPDGGTAPTTPVTPSAAQPVPRPGATRPAPTKPAPTKPIPTSSVGEGAVVTPSAATTPSSAQIGGVSIVRPVRNLAPLPFRRTLELRSPRLSGPDVLAAQNRLIALTLGPGKGDGWYGPNTARAVRDFQKANGLSASGKVDQATWDALFSSEAKGFKVGR